MKKACLSFLLIIVNMMIFAQEKTSKVDINVNRNVSTGNWYAAPWVWVVGAAVFIILLLALTSGSRRRTRDADETVTVTKTVRTDVSPDPDAI